MLPRNSTLLKVVAVALVTVLVAAWTFLPQGSLRDFSFRQETSCQPQQEEQGGGGDDVLRLGAGSMDASERYRVHRSVAEAAAGAEEPCLALHSSLGAAHHVVLQASLWNASISHAIFVAPQDKMAALAALRYLRRCFPLVRERVSFHVVHPLAAGASDSDGDGDAEGVEVDTSALACPPLTSPEESLRRLVSREPDHELQYPQNLMRNVGRSSCRGAFALTADVDMLPPGDGLQAGRLRSFLASAQALGCRKCAFTLPVFEVDSSVARIPRDKRDLRELAAAKKVRPFHWGFFKDNQRALEPLRWLKMADGPDNSTFAVASNVTFQFGFEPVFVAPRGAPTFDEVFVGFGFTRNTQAYEMILAGWRFVVLDDAFLVHQGFQNMSQRPKWRFKESAHNAGVFNHWLRRTVVKYDKDPLRLLQKYRVSRTAVQLQVKSPTVT